MSASDKLKKLNQRAARLLSHKDALKRVAPKLRDIATIIDVGAARGDWSRQALKCWPNAHCHLIEAKDLWRPKLEKFRARHAATTISYKAASNTCDDLLFSLEGDDWSGAAFKHDDGNRPYEWVRGTTLDTEVQEFALEGPFILKLDTHGTEVDILRGASHILSQTELICIETYNFNGQKRFPHMLVYLEELGFRVADLAGPMFRNHDASLWQMDFYLLRADNAVFNNNAF